MAGEILFPEWLKELERVFVTGYGYTQEQAEEYCSLNSGAWLEYWEDEYTARSAAAEDQRSGIDL